MANFFRYFRRGQASPNTANSENATVSQPQSKPQKIGTTLAIATLALFPFALSDPTRLSTTLSHTLKPIASLNFPTNLSLNLEYLSLQFEQLLQTQLRPDRATSAATQPMEPIDLGFIYAADYAESFQVEPQRAIANIAIPENWQVNSITEGVVAYQNPQPETLDIDEQLLALEPGVIDPVTGQPLDGTRHPYVTEIRLAELQQQAIAPGQYEWTGIWEGEGYDRFLQQRRKLVSSRELGDDIYINISLNTQITDPNQPNLLITLHNQQNLTGQLTNISAFRVNASTGETLERRDFEQLPPDYEVTVSRNGGFAGTETKILPRQGTVTFAYHLPPSQLNRFFPLKLQGDNRAFDERLQEIEALRSQGWLVKEVPPPS
ncbi:MAG: hypothetical protein MUF49_09020 [Oculatellaceae cyanobacterium Prado106]|jgi:hypothetical protein|nr:hypothetical protein [Oculatellaceae cyanobacterium Prado106]